MYRLPCLQLSHYVAFGQPNIYSALKVAVPYSPSANRKICQTFTSRFGSCPCVVPVYCIARQDHGAALSACRRGRASEDRVATVVYRELYEFRCRGWLPRLT